MVKKSWLLISLMVVVFVGDLHAYTREQVLRQDFLRCGVSTGDPGFSSVDGQGKWTGLDVDICRAVAAATLGDAGKVKFLPLAENESFTALLTGQVDILSRHSTWTFTRESALAVSFAGVSFYDGLGLMVASEMGVTRLDDLQKARVCSPVDSSSEPIVVNYLERNGVDYKIVPYSSLDLAVKGFSNGVCDLIASQQSQLYGLRLGLENPDSALVLSQVIAKEPLGAVVRQGDETWLNIVRGTLYAMINGEELGVNSNNIEEMTVSNRLAVNKLLGSKGAGGKGLGLNDDWAVQIIRQVGNYGEVFDRHFGPDSLVNIERGLNNLWNNGGLQYAPPF